MASRKIHVLVKNCRGINEDVELFENEEQALKAFKEYTGFEWNPEYTDQDSDFFSESFSETKIFEV